MKPLLAVGKTVLEMLAPTEYHRTALSRPVDFEAKIPLPEPVRREFWYGVEVHTTPWLVLNRVLCMHCDGYEQRLNAATTEDSAVSGG